MSSFTVSKLTPFHTGILAGVTWVTATLLLVWLGDYNMYIDYPTGPVIKEQATLTERIATSLLFGALYSFVNTVLLLTVFKFFARGSTRSAAEKPDQKTRETKDVSPPQH